MYGVIYLDAGESINVGPKNAAKLRSFMAYVKQMALPWLLFGGWDRTAGDLMCRGWPEWDGAENVLAAGGEGAATSIHAGASSTGAGGKLSLQGGAGNVGGAVQVQGGIGSTGVGGDVALASGKGQTTGGNVALRAGGSSAGGSLTLDAGLGGVSLSSGRG